MRLLGGVVHAPPIGQVLSWADEYRGTRPVIDASQGTSGVMSPQVESTLAAGSNQYGARWGSTTLRAAIGRDLDAEYSVTGIDEKDVLVTAGCNEAFCAVIRAVADPGQHVALLNPYYFNHDMWLRLNHIEPAYVEQHSDGSISEKALRSVGGSVAAVCAVSPSNPTGVELAPDTVELLVTYCREREIPLILDETYAQFRRDPSQPPHRIFHDPGWRDYFVSLRSLSKEFSIPGYRVGAAVASSDLLTAASKWHDCMAIVAPSPGQVFAEQALAHLTDWRRALAGDVRARGEQFVSRLEESKSPFVVDSWGGFFAWLQHPYTGRSDIEASRKLALEWGVLTVPGSFFSHAETGRLRLSFAALDELALTDIVDRLHGVTG